MLSIIIFLYKMHKILLSLSRSFCHWINVILLMDITLYTHTQTLYNVIIRFYHFLLHCFYFHLIPIASELNCHWLCATNEGQEENTNENRMSDSPTTYTINSRSCSLQVYHFTEFNRALVTQFNLSMLVEMNFRRFAFIFHQLSIDFFTHTHTHSRYSWRNFCLFFFSLIRFSVILQINLRWTRIHIFFDALSTLNFEKQICI